MKSLFTFQPTNIWRENLKLFPLKLNPHKGNWNLDITVVFQKAYTTQELIRARAFKLPGSSNTIF